MRIVSLLPAVTEILYAIGAGDSVVGITHECDYPPEAASKPRLIRPRVDPSAPPAEVDRQVRDFVSRGESIYAIDAELLGELAPGLIVTQDLCHVCAASPEDLASALARLPAERRPRVITYTPRNLRDVWKGIADIGEAAERPAEGRALAESLSRKVAGIEQAVAETRERPRVLCLEWFDPPYNAGHWVPEMVRLAGGTDVLGREGEPSVPIEWQDAMAARPDIVLLMSCGYGVARNVELWRSTKLSSGWNELPAVKRGQVYAVDANAYFSRSGPRLAEGVALLASLFHPSQTDVEFAPERGNLAQRLGIAAS